MARKLIFILLGVIVVVGLGFALMQYAPYFSMSQNTPAMQSGPTFAGSVSGALLATTDSSVTLGLSDGTQKTYAISTSTLVFTTTRPRPYPVSELGNIALNTKLALTFELSGGDAIVAEIHEAPSTTQ